VICVEAVAFLAALVAGLASGAPPMKALALRDGFVIVLIVFPYWTDG
jgi:hypothetical protein